MNVSRSLNKLQGLEGSFPKLGFISMYLILVVIFCFARRGEDMRQGYAESFQEFAVALEFGECRIENSMFNSQLGTVTVRSVSVSASCGHPFAEACRVATRCRWDPKLKI